MKKRVARNKKKVTPALMPIQAFHNLDQAAFAIFKEACGHEIIAGSAMRNNDFDYIAAKSYSAARAFYRMREKLQ